MEDFYRYIYFQTLDYTGTPTTSGYTLPITPFTFIPIFDDGLSVDYSNQNILWDFGDGTTSKAVTAVHHFKLPGWYNVKCYVLGKGGEGYTDKFSQNLLVRDYIADNLVLSGVDAKSETGTLQNPFSIYRFNSWQTYPSLSSTGYKINLNIEGNNAPFIDVDIYNKDKWGHLKPTSRFETFVYNVESEKEERTPVNYLYTDNNLIYVKLNRFNQLIFCKKDDVGSCFAGTSGKKVFWFIDDIPKQIKTISEDVGSNIFATFDTTKFKYNTEKEYPELEYSVLNNIYGTMTVKKNIEQLDTDHLTITSNGIDDDNNGNLIDTFNIYDTKFTGQKIPFVVRLKSSKNGKELAAKYNPTLTLKDSVTGLFDGCVYITLRDTNNQIVSGITIESDFGVLSSEKYGGYFKGYLKSDKELLNVHLNGIAIPRLLERYLVDSNKAIIAHPQSDNIHLISGDPLINNGGKQNLLSMNGLTGIYTSCVTYFRDTNSNVSTYMWLVDSDKDQVKKLELIEDKTDPSGFKTVGGITITLPENSSPSDICADKFGNVWVTLYDAVSTVRINHVSNLIDKIITPYTKNFIDPETGENRLCPASIDTDINNNIYIAYSTRKFSVIEKYNSDGVVIPSSVQKFYYQITQIVTDLNENVWGILKDTFTSTKILSSNQDQIFRMFEEKKDTYVTGFYNVGGSLWNLTTDVYRNIWITKNRNTVVKINTVTDIVTEYNLPSRSLDSPLNYISDLEGIACTTFNTILVIDSANKLLHYFNAKTEEVPFEPKAISLDNINFPTNRIQNKVNGYGDWNGFKYINKNKNLHSYPSTKLSLCVGDSNTFSIYKSDSGKYEIEKVNENFDPKEQIKSYRFQEYLIDKKVLFNDFIGTALGTLSSTKRELGKVTYEKISNFTDNISYIDTCNIKSLKSMYDMLDEDFFTFNNYYADANIPADLERLMDIFSVKFSKLKGSRDKFKYNFDDKGYNNEAILENGGTPTYGLNKGKQLDFFTSVLTSGNPIIAFEKFSEEYKYIDTNVLSSSHLHYINPVNKTYHLSGYNDYWGWGLCLPETYTSIDIPKYYLFYEYLSGYSDDQTEGVINWQSDNTNITENLSSVKDWMDIREDMLVYSLAKGLSLNK